MSATLAKRPKRITQARLEQLKLYLRRRLGCSRLFLDDPAGRTVEVRIGSETVGTLDQVEEEGETSWALTLIVLEEDLADAG